MTNEARFMVVDYVVSRCMRIAITFLACTFFAGVSALQAQDRIEGGEETIEELALTCAGCHGTKGIPQEKTTPIIWGQNEGYMYLQLRDFQKGTRKDPNMIAIVEDLSRDQLRGLAAYFTKLPWPDLKQPEPSGAIAKKAQSASVAMSCTVCHMGEYEGDGTTGRLAGQSKEYMDKTVEDFRSNERNNNPGMATMMRSMAEDDIDALHQYLASLRVQPSAGRPLN